MSSVAEYKQLVAETPPKVIHTQEENLREKHTEAADMSQKFDADIARFKELKGTH